MNSKRSYLDSLNAGRQRRSGTTVDELSRTLDAIGSRIDRTIGDKAGRQPPHRDAPYRDAPYRDAPYRDDPYVPQSRPDTGRHQSVRDLARSIETSRRQEEGVASMSMIAAELQAMRDELRVQMSSGLQREFKALRSDIEHAYSAATSGATDAELTGELERLSDAIASLASRSDDRGVALLQDDLRQVKSAIGQLAREDSVVSMERRWQDFDQRFDDRIAERLAYRNEDPAIAALANRLEQIAEAVDNIPQSISLKTLEDKVRTLAGALDRFANGHSDVPGAAFNVIEERLDEISRAIVASSMGGSDQHSALQVDQFERIEARISSLARQIEELADDRPTGELMDRINMLAQRIDGMARREHAPEAAIDRLGDQLNEIARRLDAGMPASDGEMAIHALENRFDTLADALQRQQGDADRRGLSIFRELEQRLADLNARFDNAPSATNEGPILEAIDSRFAELTHRFDNAASMGSDGRAIRGLEERLEDISARLEQSSRQSAGMDPSILRNLEDQVAALSDHLARPAGQLPAFEDIAPRLSQIEDSIASNREALLDAAKAVAEQTMRQMATARDDSPIVLALSEDLKALDHLTRRSDERNSRTFEAIHDTLLKIVDRLGVLENGAPESVPVRLQAAAPSQPRQQAAAPSQARQQTVAPSIEPDFAEDASSHELEPSAIKVAGRSPAEAAAAAANAAIGSNSAVDDERGKAGRSSMLGGLARAFAGRKEAAAQPQMAEVEPQMAEPSVDLDASLDTRAANKPLEPGATPDLNAIMKRVRTEAGRTAQSGDADTAKADFIAAARRAAQAAAADAETRKKSVAGGESKGSKLAGIFSRHRKSMLVAAGGVVLMIAAMQLGRAFLADDAGAENAAAPTSSIVEVPSSQQASIAPAVPAAVTEPAPEARTAMQTAEEEPATDDATETTSSLPEEINEPSPAAEAMSTDAPDQALLPPAGVTKAYEVPVAAGPVTLRDAAEQGDAKALFEIGSRYAEGRGGDQDLKQAAIWYERSAEAGFAPAQYRIGNFYEKAIGVDRDLAKAKTWYQLAAQQGNASAMHNLAVLFAMGADGTTDNDSAGRWFIKAAELGVKDSQFNLGILSAKGIGVPLSLEESYKWFALVAKTGDKDAAQKRDDVAKALRPEQLAKARASADLWKPKELSVEANDVSMPDEWRESQAKTASVDMKQAVRNIQLILNKNGYDAGGADGVMGGKTKSAIATFQRDNGLEPTGEVNEELIGMLLKKK